MASLSAIFSVTGGRSNEIGANSFRPDQGRGDEQNETSGQGLQSIVSRVGDGQVGLLLRMRMARLIQIASLWPILLLHGSAFAGIYLLAHVIRCDGAIPDALWDSAIATLPLVVGVKIAAFLARGCHRGWWRSATFADVASLVEAATLGSLILALASCYSSGVWPAPRSVLVIDWTASLLVLCGARGATRLMHDHYGPLFSASRLRPVFIIGAGEAGEALAKQIASQSKLGLRVVGFLDADRNTQGRVLAGARVLGNPDDLARLASRHKVGTVLIPSPAVPAREIRALSRSCNAAGVKAQVVPGFDALLSGNLTAIPRDVDIQDLLCRESVQLDNEALGEFLEGRVVLVTGASGSIGSEICRQALAFRPGRLILLDHSENGLFFLERQLNTLASAETEVIPIVASITDLARVRDLFAEHRPQVVFHAAAHKHVPMMESNPGEAVKNNVFGTRTLVDESIRAGVDAFVMISTDKAVNPTSVMGVCKRLGEMYMQSLAGQAKTRLVTVRFGNVLGSTGSVVPIFKEQIRNGESITITHPEMTRYFMTIPEASQLVLQAGAQGHGGEIFVLDMGEPIRILDLARDMIRLSGLVEGRDVQIVFTGLRPGEKLYEELYDQGETLLMTSHPKIRAAQHHSYPRERIVDGLSRLQSAVDGHPDQIIALLSELVPGYRPRRGNAPQSSLASTEPRCLADQAIETRLVSANDAFNHDPSECAPSGFPAYRLSDAPATLARLLAKIPQPAPTRTVAQSSLLG